MEFDWSLYKSSALTQEQVAESFEDPLSFRLLPDANRFSTQNRFISLGCSDEGTGVFAVYTSTGKIVRVVAARFMTDEEALFYKRRAQDTLLTIMSLPVINDFEKIPLFASLDEEAHFWEQNQVSQRLMQLSLVRTDSNESTTITLRIDPRMLSRLKRLARQRYLNYQSMLKQWVAERLEKELE